jgi:hypothetical protein
MQIMPRHGDKTITNRYPFVLQQGGDYVVQQQAEFSGGINLWIRVHINEEDSGSHRGLVVQVANAWSANRGTNKSIL